MAKMLYLIVLVLGFMTTPVFGNEVVLEAVDKGRVRQDGNIGGGGPSNYASGISAGFNHRSFFIFSIPPLDGQVITSATLKVFNPDYSSPDPTETLTLFDVDPSSVTELLSNADPVSVAVFNDVGSGNIFGQRIVSDADDGQLVEITFNAAGLAALNNAKGGTSGVGGALTTLSGQTSSNELVFSGSGPSGQVSLLLSTETPCVVPPSGLVSWWPGDGNANDIADDNDGALFGGATFATGLVGNAFSLDGDGDGVVIRDNANLDITNAITIDAWIKRAVAGSRHMILNKRTVPLWHQAYALWVAPDNLLKFAIGDGTTEHKLAYFGETIQPDQWYHVAGTYDGTTQRIYLNGQEVATATFSVAISTTDEALRIGVQSTGEDSFDGLIDEVELFNRALTSDEIRAIFNVGSVGKCKSCVTPPSNLVSWWPGDGNANDIFDGNDGALFGGATFATGLVDNAFSLDGIDDMILVGDSASLDITEEITIDAWVFRQDVGTQAVAFRKSLNCLQYGLAILNNKLAFTYRVVCGSVEVQHQFLGSTALSINEWHHIAARYKSGDQSSVKLFVDGIEDSGGSWILGDGTGSMTSFPSSLTIGAFERDSGVLAGFFDGLIDEVEIYDRALTSDEIQAIFNAGFNGKCKPNVAVTSVTSNLPLSDPNRPLRIFATVANTGPEDILSLDMTLFLDVNSNLL